MMQRRLLLTLAFASLSVPLGYGGAQTGALVITDTTLIDGVSETALPNMSVIIRGDRITAVGPSDDIATPAEATVIDGSGKFLIPGLWDMHAHLSYWGEDALELLVAIASI